MSQILLKNADFVILSPREYLVEASVLVEGNRIKAVSSLSGVQIEPDTQVIDCAGKMILPGLVNAHNHIVELVERGLGKSLNTEDWMVRYIYPINKALSDEDYYLATLLGCADMLRNGTTSVIDMLPNYVRFHAGAILRGFMDVGIRAGVAITAATASRIDPGEILSSDEEISRAVEHVQKYGTSGLVSAWLGSSGFHACDPDTLARVKQVANQLGARYHIHLNETRYQLNLAREHGYIGQVAWADDIGILDQNTLVAHSVWTSPEEISILAERQACVAHNATSNQILASGIAPVTEMLQAGVTVALGSDGPGSNDSVDMVAEMKAAVLLQRVRKLDPEALSARDGLEMVTKNGPKALGYDPAELGVVAPGAFADLTCIRLGGNPSMSPVHDPVDSLVYSGSGRDTWLTMVNGRVLYHDGVYPTIGKDRLAEAALQLRRRVVEIIGSAVR